MTNEGLAAVTNYLHKKAEGEIPLPDFAGATQQVANEQAKSQLVNGLVNLGATGVGLGAGARGLMGLFNLINSNATGNKKVQPLSPMTIDVPIPQKQQKHAGIVDDLKNFVAGNDATSPGGIPWAVPASLAVGAGSVYGGWKATDAILDARRKAQLQTEMDEAQKQYDQALSGQFQDPNTPAQKVASTLDLLFDVLEDNAKEANFITDHVVSKDTLGKLTGGYLGVAGIGALATALATYNYTKNRQPSNLLAKAQQKRMREMYQNRPTPLFARAALPEGVQPTSDLEYGNTSTPNL